MGSYEVHIYSQSVSYRNHRSAQPQFGEVESRSSSDAQLCTAVNGVQRKSQINHLKQDSPKMFYISSSVLLYISIRLRFLLALHFLNRRTPVSLRISANAEGYREFSFIFIGSKPLIQQLGLALYSAQLC